MVDAGARLAANVYEWFDVQERGMRYGAERGHLPQWAQDLGGADGGDAARKRYLTASLATFWAAYARAPPAQRTFYETVLPGLPCRWHLDVDVDRTTNPALDPAALRAALHRCLRLFLAATFGAPRGAPGGAGLAVDDDNGVEIVELDSSSADGRKLSWHWIVHMRRPASEGGGGELLLRDSRHAGALTRRFDRYCWRLASLADGAFGAAGMDGSAANADSAAAKLLRVAQRAGKRGDAAARCAAYDLKIYSLAREFRVFGSHKSGSERTLRIVAPAALAAALATPADFGRTLIQCYSGDAGGGAAAILCVSEYDGGEPLKGGTEYGHMRDLTDEFTPPAYAAAHPPPPFGERPFAAADAPLPLQALPPLAAALAEGAAGVRTPAQEAADARAAAAAALAATHGGHALASYYASFFPFSLLASFFGPAHRPAPVLWDVGGAEGADDDDVAELARREFAAAYRSAEGGEGAAIFARYQSYATAAEWRAAAVARAPLRIEVGAVYSQEPAAYRAAQRAAAGPRRFLSDPIHSSSSSSSSALSASAAAVPVAGGAADEYRPVERELVFDVDMDAPAYADRRAACCGATAAACARCWRLVAAPAAAALAATLRAEFGFRRLLFVFSGRRGLHCWVADARARRLDDAQRAAIVSYVERRHSPALLALDGDVTRQMRHLLKAPFAVHPATRRVCVALDERRIADFDPQRDAPALESLVVRRDPQALDAFAASVAVLRAVVRT